ncbi:hypothetical protein [Streptomyces kanasensis]|uniref:hypothetical protein n=1 Tax=Streptomyces kanasensis TaxID=936756 RepID=UPI000B1B428C|nr:hypothetical protein [Streptomyces kanasensis]
MASRRTQDRPPASNDRSDGRPTQPGRDLGWEFIKGTFHGVGRGLGQFLVELVRVR